MGLSDSQKGFLQPQSEAWKSAVRVRMLHGVARRRILERYNANPDIFGAAGYDLETDGFPINQEDMAATLGSFCVVGRTLPPSLLIANLDLALLGPAPLLGPYGFLNLGPGAFRFHSPLASHWFLHGRRTGNSVPPFYQLA